MIRFVATQLRDARRARGWSMSQLRARSGIGTSTISRVERGAAYPSVPVLVRWLNALALGPDLVMVRDTPTPARPWPAEYEPPLF